MRILKKVFCKISRLTFPIRTKIFYLFFKRKKYRSSYDKELVDQTFLVIAPHADDEYIGCCELIKAKSKQNRIYAFLCSYLGSDLSEENKTKRENEFVKSCDYLRINYLISHSGIEDDLNKFINEVEPDIIFIPSIVDPHYEHRKINYVLFNVIRRSSRECKIVWYPVSMPIHPEFVNFIQGYSEKEKWERFKSIYSSQVHMHLERFQAEERMLGKLYGMNAGEGFLFISFNQWRKTLINFTEDMARELDMIKKKNIEDRFFKIYRLSKRYYTSLLNNDFSKPILKTDEKVIRSE